MGSGFDLVWAFEELEGLKSKLNDDKVARRVQAPALLLMRVERLGVDETTLKYFGAVLWSAVGGDDYVSAAMKEVGLTSGKDSTALLWGAAWAAHGARLRAAGARRVFQVVASNNGAVRLAQLYALFGPPMLEEEGFIDHKLVETVELGSEVSVEVVRVGETMRGNVVATIHVSAAGGGVWREFNVYLGEDVELSFASTNREEVELRAHLLRLASVETRVRKEGGRGVWYLGATTDRLAAGGEELRRELAGGG